MQCKNHPSEKGVNTCNQCGIWICDKCSFEQGGRIFCPKCAAQQVSKSELPPTRPKGSDKPINWGLLFLFTVVLPLPGLNYMYMGFIKRGLLAMSAFFGLIFVMIQFFVASAWPLGILAAFAIPVMWIGCAFDGFRIRTRLNEGEVITDNIDDVLAFLRRNRFLLVGMLVVLVATNAFGGMFQGISGMLHYAIPVLLVVWAIKFLFKK